MSEEELTLFGVEGEEKPRRWVTVSNEMIMARLDWNIMMHRILMVLISQIDSKNDEQFRTQRVPVRRIRDMAQVTRSRFTKRQPKLHQSSSVSLSSFGARTKGTMRDTRSLRSASTSPGRG
jgi:hypothetical protein